jgi:hypothetical protein
VTDAVGGSIRLRALVSAPDAPSLWDLRCLVRERLVAWVWEHQRDALPRVRADVGAPSESNAPLRPVADPDRDASGGGREPSRDGRGASGDGRDASGGGRGASGDARDASGDGRVFSGGDDGEARGVTFGGPDESSSAPIGN